MTLFKLIVGLFLPFFSPILPFSIVLDTDQTCTSTNILCLSNNTFTYCGVADNVFFVSRTEWSCPDTFICSNSGNSPCIPDPSITTTTAQPTTTECVPTTTTPVPTTTVGTTTTVGPPTCTSNSLWKGPTCSQYYECYQFLWWYQSDLKSCNEGYHFSVAQSACVPEAESDCA